MRYIAQLAKYGWFTSSPADVNGSVDIGVGCVITRATPKLVLALSVLFGAVSALSAGTAGIARIDGHEMHSGKSGFVFQKQPELRERPGMQNCTLPLPGLDPFADTIQIFDGNSATGAFSFGNDLLADVVVHPCGEALFFTSQLLQPPLCRTSLFLLKFGSQSAVTVAHRLDLRTGVALAIRVAGDAGDAQIDTEKLCWLDWRCVRKIDSAVEIEPALAVRQIGLTFDPVKPLLLVFAVDQRHDYAAFRQGPQADTVQSLESHDAFVVSDRAIRLKDWTFCLIAREAFNGLANSADSHLSGELELRANLRVSQFVDRWLAVNFRLESTLSREGSGFVDPLHSGKQPLALFGVRQNLQLEREFHYYGVYHSLERDGAIPLPAKAGSLLAQNL